MSLPNPHVLFARAPAHRSHTSHTSYFPFSNQSCERLESRNEIPSISLLNGQDRHPHAREIEALDLLTGVQIFQAASGGVAGAEG